jgi:hypothetical protein
MEIPETLAPCGRIRLLTQARERAGQCGEVRRRHLAAGLRVPSGRRSGDRRGRPRTGIPEADWSAFRKIPRSPFPEGLEHRVGLSISRGSWKPMAELSRARALRGGTEVVIVSRGRGTSEEKKTAEEERRRKTTERSRRPACWSWTRKGHPEFLHISLQAKGYDVFRAERGAKGFPWGDPTSRSERARPGLPDMDGQPFCVTSGMVRCSVIVPLRPGERDDKSPPLTAGPMITSRSPFPWASFWRACGRFSGGQPPPKRTVAPHRPPRGGPCTEARHPDHREIPLTPTEYEILRVS